MSESDDSDIQADIQALTEALSLPTTSDPQQQLISSNSRSDSTPSIDFDGSDDECFNYICENQDNESLNVYEMNEKLITGLMIAKKKLIVLLQECERKIKEVEEKMSSSERSSLRIPSRIAITNAGMPYFKDKNHFRAPKNCDMKLKEQRGELFLSSLRKPSRWTGRDREILLKAIENEAIESVLSKGFNDDKQSDEETLNNQAKNMALLLPRNFKEMVGAVGEREFDWHKISRIDFDDKHSPGECQAMWNVYLHPDFNKNEWTNAEDKKLLQYAKECEYQDWDTITQLLETNRSAYQCFIRYNTIKKMPSVGHAWTKEEDKCLANIINQLQIGDYIPWSEVANHMRHRTKQQVYTRWMYRTAPHLRKGRFTYLETKTLMDAVEKYGMDFCKISNVVMPYRTSTQLSERYHTVMKNMNNDKTWTIDDDERLLQLHKNYNNDWSKIAMNFSNKSRTELRQRFTAIQKYIKKNISVQDIPRQSKNGKQVSMYKQLSKNTLEQCNKTASIDDIQLRLYEILSLPPLEIINSQKSYDSEQLAYDTRRLYDTLNLLNVNFDFSSSSVNFVHLNKKEKLLLASLKEYINVRNNGIQNHERIEKFRMQMFGRIEKVSESSFIPPLPFDGYIRTKKIKRKDQSIDCELNVNEKFLIDVPTEFSTTFYIDFINHEEEIQFYKFSQLLLSDYYECDERHINLYKLLECNLSFDKASTSPEYHNSTDVDLKLTNYKQRKCSNKLQTPISTEYTNDEYEEKLFTMSNIIMPNRATLLGFKNLLLWKLLYECQNKSEHCELLFKSEQQETEQTTTNCPIQTESAEYQLLQIRLLQLFKLPIGLSNSILELSGPAPIFLTKKDENQKTVSKKRKFEDVNSGELNKEINNYNTLANSSSKFDSNIETADLPIVRNCKVVCKKYKIIAK
ncbi:snRNA-activating protein complex subunit 4 [Formica fusca]